MAHVRDRPSLRESTVVTTPGGKTYRWADDEPEAINIPSGERWSDTMPGGYETHDAVLPRKPGLDYADLERLSELTRYDAAGEVIWQGRLERAPRVSGDQVAISPSAVGYQAHLDDDKSARVIFQDIDLTHWGPPSSTRRASLNASWAVNDPQLDTVGVSPAVRTMWIGPWGTGVQRPISEAWYDGKGCSIGYIEFQWVRNPNTTSADTNWIWLVLLAPNDSPSVIDQTGTLRLAPNSFGTLTATTSDRTFACVETLYQAASASQAEFGIYWPFLNISGDHGLTKVGAYPGGYLDGDMVGYALDTWCPLISHDSESITNSSFAISHALFLEPTTTSEIIRQVTRFGLRDWAVWEGPKFWLHDRGARGRSWVGRVGPTKLEETGPQVDRLWNSIVVAYQDVNGSTRTVGPIGSGADTEDDSLTDPDPENPATKLGIIRRDTLTMGVSTSAGAIEIGRRFLEESKVLDSSGRATFVPEELPWHCRHRHGSGYGRGAWAPLIELRAYRSKAPTFTQGSSKVWELASACVHRLPLRLMFVIGPRRLVWSSGATWF